MVGGQGFRVKGKILGSRFEGRGLRIKVLGSRFAGQGLRVKFES